jgi:hypothetical protein
MKKNTYLVAAEKMLKKQKMFTTFVDENILEVCLNKSEKPFAFLLIEEEQFNGVVVCLALDFHQTYIVADLIINLMHIAPVALGEAFYRSVNGNLYWNEEAQLHFELEYNKDLLDDLPTINDTMH